MGLLPAYVSVHTMGAAPVEARRGDGILWADVTETFERPRGFWDANPGPLEGHLMPLATKPSGQPQQGLF